MLLTASLLSLEPTLKRNQALCLACKCLTINQHHKTQSGSRRDAPSLSLSSYFSQVPSISPSPNPLLFIFPQLLLGGSGCWAYATVPLPFSFSQSAPQPCDSHQSAADAMATGPLGERSSGPPGLYEPCRLTEQRSPPPHLDKGEGPRTSTVHTHTCLTTNIHK